jgi:hypothetical protein
MARVFDKTYGSRKAIRRNAYTVVFMSVVLYVLGAILAFKGGLDAAYPVILVAVVIDVFCLVVWLVFRSKNSH